MKRLVDYHLLEWKNRTYKRTPLLLRGARQVGKTHAARTLGKTFDTFIEVNLETNPEARRIMEKDLDAKRIVQELSNSFNTPIKPGSTLLFIDEIQTVPQAITALRYFYELMPDLHVLAAGSLVDFAISQVGMPVGRVSGLYVYPLSFLEFLAALGHAGWIKLILSRDEHNPISSPLHDVLINLVGTYLAIGGMPDAVDSWITTEMTKDVKIAHAKILLGYKQDFEKYAKQHQLKYLELLYTRAILQLGRKFMYSKIGEYKKRELQPSLELLEKAGLFHPVMKSAGQGIPIGGQADPDFFKLIFLDVGLTQALLGFDITSWVLDTAPTFINKGELIEAFVGQELLVYTDPMKMSYLFYWQREMRGSEAEVDYLLQIKESVIPIEVKSGEGSTLKSMYSFLETHQKSPYGIRFSTQGYSVYENIKSYPLYAIIKPLMEHINYDSGAILSLIE